MGFTHFCENNLQKNHQHPHEWSVRVLVVYVVGGVVPLKAVTILEGVVGFGGVDFDGFGDRVKSDDSPSFLPCIAI